MLLGTTDSCKDSVASSCPNSISEAAADRQMVRSLKMAEQSGADRMDWTFQ